MSNQDYKQYSSGYPQILWGQSISEKTSQALRDLGWIDPNDIQNIKGELEQARATILVNFGPEGKCRSGLASDKDNLSKMITDVASWYEEQIKKDNHQAQDKGKEKSMSEENSWPEQDFVEQWTQDFNIVLSNKARHEIAKRMTKPRLELQEIRERLNKYFKENDME